MTRHFFRCWALAALALFACAAVAAPPREILISKEVQDLYRVSSGLFWIKTIGCHENVYNDRASLRFNISGRGGMLFFRSGRQCVVEKFFVEIESGKLPAPPRLF